MKKKILSLAMISLVTMIFSGCATVLNDKTQPVSFNSIPEGAKVIVNGRLIGKTPMSFNVERNNDAILRIEKKGYETVQQPLNTEISAAFFGNILIGGVLGSTTDATNKKMYEFSPNHYTIELKKLEDDEKEDKKENI